MSFKNNSLYINFVQIDASLSKSEFTLRILLPFSPRSRQRPCVGPITAETEPLHPLLLHLLLLQHLLLSQLLLLHRLFLLHLLLPDRLLLLRWYLLYRLLLFL